MPQTIKVVIINENYEERINILNSISYVNDITVAGEADTVEKGMQLVADIDPGVIIVGDNIEGSDSFSFSESVISAYAFQQIILVTAASGEDIYRRAMRAGIKEILEYPVDQISICDAIYKAFDLKEKQKINYVPAKIESGIHDKTAKIISVFSTKGGVGKTTISSNLAVALRQLGKKVALLDLDVYSGDAALALDIVPKMSLSDLANDIGKLDLDLLESYMSKHSSGLMVLPAPMKLEYADFVAADHINKILKILLIEYDYIVIDCASYMHDPVLVGLDASDIIILVTTMDIFAIKNLKSCVAALEASNYNRTKFRLVVNRACREAGISEKDIEVTMGLPITAILPQEDQVIIKSVNQGTPAVICYKRSGFSQGIFELAGKISGDISGKATTDKSRKSGSNLLMGG